MDADDREIGGGVLDSGDRDDVRGFQEFDLSSLLPSDKFEARDSSRFWRACLCSGEPTYTAKGTELGMLSNFARKTLYHRLKVLKRLLRLV